MNIAMNSLSCFQDAFAATLRPDAAAPPPAIAALVRQPGFQVYRNTVTRSCIDALQANYPTINRLVGDEWMRAAAAVYAGSTLPDRPMLLAYGSDFADFLRHFEPAADLPYLPDVARLDRCWTEAHIAATEASLNHGELEILCTSRFDRLRLVPHASARWHWSGEQPAYTIWSRNRAAETVTGDIDWHGEGALLTRPQDHVTWRALDLADCVFLDCCKNNGSVADAAEAALDADVNADLGRMITTLLEAGAFSRIEQYQES